MKTYRYVVSGRVQGVCFRHYTVREAEKLGVAGTVRNLPDGDVEVFAQGGAAAIERFESFLRVGPPAAGVDGVAKETLDQGETFTGFDIAW